MPTSERKPPWYRLTPDRLILTLLAVEGLLWLSARLGWPVWHKGYAVLAAVAAVGMAFLVMLVWFAAALIVRWRFQFSLQSLLVLVVVVAVPCSWMAVEMKAAKQQKETVRAFERFPNRMSYDYHVQRRGSAGPVWLSNLLGVEFLRRRGFRLFGSR